MLNLTRFLQPPSRDFLEWLTATGFDTLLLALPRDFGTADVVALPPIVEDATAAGLKVHLDLMLHVAGENAPAVRRHPEWYKAIARRPADPRSCRRRLD